MKNGMLRVTASVVALVIGTAVGCSSSSDKPKPGVLPPGTAQFTIDGKTTGTTGTVHCAAVEWVTTIKTGDDATGVTVMVIEKGKPVVEFVRIRNLNGFSGDYNRNLEGSATVAMTDATFRIDGTVVGYGPTSIAPTTQPFTVKVAC